MRTLDLSAPLVLGEQRYLPPAPPVKRFPGSTFRQLQRFGVVGCLNTLIDLLALNGLFWLWPTQNVGLLLIENSIAYGFGAVNSFFLNKYWTFRCTERAGRREVARFALTALAGAACNNLILWLMSHLL